MDSMNRRHYLTGVASVATVAVAGCQHNDGENGVRVDTTVDGVETFTVAMDAGERASIQVDTNGPNAAGVQHGDSFYKIKDSDTVEFTAEETRDYRIRVTGRDVAVKITVSA